MPRPSNLNAIAAMLVAVASFAVMDAALKQLSGSYPPLQVASLRAFASLPFLLAALAWTGGWRELRMQRPVLHLLRGLLGQYFITEAFSRAPPFVVAPFEYTAILWAFSFDWLFWQVLPTVVVLLGGAIVVSCGLYIIWDERRSYVSTPSQAA
jgi:drug/metabolite transporter (DMT)-like permease